MAKFIAFEGVDGSGKTTCVDNVKRMLQEAGKTVFSTAEPTKYLKKKFPYLDELNNIEKIFLFSSDRKQHQKIFQKHKNKDFILCDRYVLSTLAYNCETFEETYLACTANLGILIPYLTVILSVDIDIALERLKSRSEEPTYYEEKTRLIKVHKKYLKLTKDIKKGYEKSVSTTRNPLLIVNSHLPSQEVAKIVFNHLMTY